MVSVQDDALDQASEPYVGRWSRLISTTNWEKGSIIHAWREDLAKRNRPPAEYSDEAWSRLVGGVSPQHVGRLRRVFERFDAVREEYEGLYWSHFQAALDWEDAEMWLEGALQNGWSVSQMRAKRHETLDAPAELMPREEDIIQSELDEDVDPRLDELGAERLESTVGVVRDPQQDASPDDGEPPDSASAERHGRVVSQREEQGAASVEAEQEPVRPFENIPPLPDDLADALESFKLAVLRHKLAGWQEISSKDVLAVLEALKILVTAPSE